jgi:hypothetical protein
MRRLAPLLALIAIAVLAVPVMAAPHSKLKTFGTGDVTLVGSDGADIVNNVGEYGGVYLAARRNARPIQSVHFSFRSTGQVGGGAPRFSIPIDTDHNHTVEAYAFIDVNGCGGASLVSTASVTCTVYFQSDVFANWGEFADAHPDYRIPPGAIPFVIADVEGSYEVRDVDLR